MPIKATITPPIAIQTGNFTVGITFEVGLVNLTADKLSVTAVSGNGITGVTFEVLPDHDMDSQTYNVFFMLSEDVAGALQIDITGMVTRVGSDAPEAVVATAVTVTYDNITNVTATLGDAVYRDDGEIVVPVVFGENVIVPSKSVFAVKRVLGDDLQGFEYYLFGEGKAWELVFRVPPNRSRGSFQITAVADVLKVATGVWDNVIATPLVVPYGTILPRIVDYDIPANYSLGSPVDVRVAYNVVVTGWNVNNTITNPGIFEMEGAHLGTPLPYKWIGAGKPDFDDPVPADLTGSTDWQLLKEPPAGDPTPGMNDFDTDSQWHGESGQYYLIRFPNPKEVGIFNLRERVGMVRGPVN